MQSRTDQRRCLQSLQEEDNVIPLRPFGAIPTVKYVNATFRNLSRSHPFDVPPNVNATNLERFRH